MIDDMSISESGFVLNIAPINTMLYANACLSMNLLNS